MAYWFKVTHPNASENIPQLRSECLQKPFYFGGSQVPSNLGLSKQLFSGAGFVGDKPPRQRVDSGYHILKVGSTEGKGMRLHLKR